MQARDVHAQVETILGEPTVRATLAGNLGGPAPRFVRVARGRYGIPLRSAPVLDRGATADASQPGAKVDLRRPACGRTDVTPGTRV
jgi:hypothetical protein